MDRLHPRQADLGVGIVYAITTRRERRICCLGKQIDHKSGD